MTILNISHPWMIYLDKDLRLNKPARRIFVPSKLSQHAFGLGKKKIKTLCSCRTFRYGHCHPKEQYHTRVRAQNQVKGARFLHLGRMRRQSIQVPGGIFAHRFG